MATQIRLGDKPRTIEIVRAAAVPVVTTIFGSAVSLLPLGADGFAIPPTGLLMLLGWRLLRPELWPVWVGLPLGLVDDLLTGAPIGSAMSLWTLTLLVLDVLDSYLIWRDYWIDWLMAATAMLIVISCQYWFTGFTETVSWLDVILPEIILSSLCFPLAVRLCVRLDRWRLPR